ncbi:LON peptidase substrate-binding domain-containing protein [Photobacterium sp. Hal280]|uniref:LON peptidase substrate-binding domain-containing protein n=1 Tax=Photobacterium sp. Hal280 TaxID=3035163 RepID=UPI00301D6AF3
MSDMIPLIFQQRHILPGGRIPVRIPPGSQMETFKVALASGNGFGICMFDEDEHGQHFCYIGTRVTVEDFDISSQDGALIATLYGHSNFRIKSLDQADNGVFYADPEDIPQWPDMTLRDDQQPLAEKLQVMFNNHPELDKLHQTKYLNNLSWLCQRWLELLPLPAFQKQALLTAPNCLNTYDYLQSIMQQNH